MRRLHVLVFVVGAASLGTEIAAARLLAPDFGASTFVWANTIAVVLVALSVGYALGGRLADRSPELPVLGRIVVVAAATLAAVPFVSRPFLHLAVGALDGISAGAFLGSLAAVLLLVAGPVTLLGMVAPYAVRLAVGTVEEAGTVTGRLYALSTAGSLVGTFLAALVLIPFAGTHRTFLVFALALGLAGALAARTLRLTGVAAVIAVLIVLPPPAVKSAAGHGKVIYETETPYQYARVIEGVDGTRRLELNEGQATHSLRRPGTFLTDDYWDEFLVLPSAVLGRAPRSVAILGSAGGTTARAYGHYFPSTRVDAVEIDGRLNDVARRYFDLSGPRLRVFQQDARPFLRQAADRYDAILLDAYRQPYVPFYLATREFFALTRQRLAPGGVVVINVGHPRGSTQLERVLTRTLRSVFRHVARDPSQPTNTLLVAGDAPASAAALQAAGDLAPVAAAAAKRLAPGLQGGTVYTDDRAPVEWLIDRSLLAYAAGD